MLPDKWIIRHDRDHPQGTQYFPWQTRTHHDRVPQHLAHALIRCLVLLDHAIYTVGVLLVGKTKTAAPLATRLVHHVVHKSTGANWRAHHYKACFAQNLGPRATLFHRFLGGADGDPLFSHRSQHFLAPFWISF